MDDSCRYWRGDQYSYTLLLEKVRRSWWGNTEIVWTSKKEMQKHSTSSISLYEKMQHFFLGGRSRQQKNAIDQH